MAKYIDANELLKAMDSWDKYGFSHSGAFVREPENDDYVSYVHYEDMVKCVEGMPTVDVMEMFIDELTKKISGRIIQALEANYEIIPKKPVVRCKDCKWHSKFLGEGFCSNFSITGFENDDYCSYGVKRDDGEIH